MISMVVGLVLLAGMTTLFLNQNRTQGSLERTSRLIENGRYALQLITDDLQVAGYYWIFDPSDFTPPDPLNPCDTNVNTLRNSLPVHVQGLDHTVSPPPPWPCVIDKKPDTDVLVIRRAAPLAQTVPPSNATFFMQVSRCPTNFGAQVFDRAYTSLNLTDKDCSTLAPAHRLLVRIYYIATTTGIPTLTRVELNQAGVFTSPQALVEGIEDLQLEFGIDGVVAGMDGVPDDFDPCDLCPPEEFARTVAMRVHILARSMEAAKQDDGKVFTIAEKAPFDPNDNFKRQVYSQYVELVNPITRITSP